MLVRWQRTTDGEWPYRASAEGHELAVRVNDFPAEPLYSILVDGEAIADLGDEALAGGGVIEAEYLVLVATRR